MQTDARLFMLTPTAVRLVECTKWGTWLKTDQPVSVEIDLEARTVRPSRGSQAEVKLSDAAYDAARQAVGEVLNRMAQAPPEVRPVPPPAEPAIPQAKISWETKPLAEGAVRFIRNADGIQPGAVVAAVGPKAVCLDTGGKVLWEFAAQGTVNDVWVADLDRPDRTLYAPGPEVLAASDDENLYVLSAAGEKLKELHIDYPLRVGRSSIRQPRVSNVLVADLEGKGEPSIIVGTLNGNLARLNAALERQWIHDEIEHGTREIKLADLNADGEQEILVANKYGAVEVFTGDGGEMRGVYSELGDVEFAVGDIDGDGTPEILNGSSTGAFCCAKPQGDVLWRFSNYGYAAYDVEIANLDGAQRAVAASETGYVYVLDGSGNVVSQALLGPAVRRLAFLPAEADGKQIAVAGCDGGEVYFLSPDMRRLAVTQAGSRVTAMAGVKEAVVVGLGDGRIMSIKP